ncbi:DUF5683 domain-containing protein [Flavobacterium sp. JP2137]|uniref:DUF5683 domain-containing protein n=1 Tax=Flavobacterium sp. JP2137 TaxID=3414510 RepID=UPI003D3003D2
MKRTVYLLVLGLLLIHTPKSYSQSANDSLKFSVPELVVDQPMDPLSPARAAFYSAVVPGLGQFYNKKYWKVPIPYIGMGISIYFYSDNHKKYKEYRNEYKKRLNHTNDPNDSRFGKLDNDRVIQGQRFYQRNRDLSAVITAGIYIISIIDANIDAHLLQFNVSDQLTFQPTFQLNEIDYQYQYGLSVQYKF